MEMKMDYLDVKGRIFDIQKFSIHDGPGIRTLVFFKGCFLRCKWCCNPEGQEFEIQTMVTGGKEKTVGKDVTVGDVMDEIMRDMPYYRRSGGGVTLSGGEVLGQIDFACALLKVCKENGLNTAIESTGYAKYDEIKKILPYLDLYLMDIKHLDSGKHKAFTSVPNELVLENAKRLARDVRELIIRVPVIPTFNDSESEIRDIARFAKGLLAVKELHLLPYHALGTDKYTGLKREYALKNITPPAKEKMHSLLEVVKSEGLICRIGG